MINQHIYISVDAILFSIIDSKPHVLLIKRKYNPFSHQLAFPGGFVKDHETLKEAVIREIEEETNLKNVENIEILNIYDAVDRDPRGRVISIAFVGAVDFELSNHVKPSEEVMAVEWVPVSEIKDLAFDHNQMLSDALNFLASFEK